MPQCFMGRVQAILLPEGFNVQGNYSRYIVSHLFFLNVILTHVLEELPQSVCFSSCGNAGPTTDYPYRTSWKNSLELIELSNVNEAGIGFHL